MSEYQLLFEGTPAADDFYEQISRLEIEENADLPGAISLTLPVGVADGELTFVTDARVGPYANIAVLATAPDAADQCIFDGYVLTHKVHLPTGTAGATLEVWGQDASVLMGLTEHVKVWSGMSDADVAGQILSSYDVGADASNSKEPGPVHSEDEHSLVQRDSDAEFLRRLARRTGRWFRVVSTDKPGVRTGVFASPSLDRPPVATIGVTDPATSAVPVLDFAWDAARPTTVHSRQVSFTDGDQAGVSADTSDSGLALLEARGLAAFAGQERTVVLTAAADTAALPDRSAGLLRESGWFVRCEGTADVNVLKCVLRVGDVVEVEGCGSLLSGKYLVWSVRHTITTQAHTMAFVLVSNAVGPGGVMSDDVLHDLVDQLRSRYYGKYRGIVTDVDPEHMRVKATVPAVLADAEVWCMPCVPFAGPAAGFCFLPPSGSGVWIEFEGGDPSLGIWTGSFWVDEDVPSDVAAKVAVIATPGGHKLVFDDDAGEIRIEDSNGGSIVFDSSGVTAKRDSSSVAVSSSSVSVNDGAMEVS